MPRVPRMATLIGAARAYRRAGAPRAARAQENARPARGPRSRSVASRSAASACRRSSCRASRRDRVGSTYSAASPQTSRERRGAGRRSTGRRRRPSPRAAVRPKPSCSARVDERERRGVQRGEASAGRRGSRAAAAMATSGSGAAARLEQRRGSCAARRRRRRARGAAAPARIGRELLARAVGRDDDPLAPRIPQRARTSLAVVCETADDRGGAARAARGGRGAPSAAKRGVEAARDALEGEVVDGDDLRARRGACGGQRVVDEVGAGLAREARQPTRRPPRGRRRRCASDPPPGRAAGAGWPPRRPRRRVAAAPRQQLGRTCRCRCGPRARTWCR